MPTPQAAAPAPSDAPAPGQSRDAPRGSPPARWCSARPRPRRPSGRARRRPAAPWRPRTRPRAARPSDDGLLRPETLDLRRAVAVLGEHLVRVLAAHGRVAPDAGLHARERDRHADDGDLAELRV